MELAFIDLETTGLNPNIDRITEITVKIKTENGYNCFSTLINPEIEIPKNISDLTGITNDLVAGKPIFHEIAKHITDLLDKKIIVGHNVKFDLEFLYHELLKEGIELGDRRYICTCENERKLRGKPGNKLSECLSRRGIAIKKSHRSEADVDSTIALFDDQAKHMIKMSQHIYHHKSMRHK